MVIANTIRSWLLLVPLIPSIMVTIFNLYHLLSSRALRTALNNHIIILLLLVGLIETLTDVLWNIYFLRTNNPLSSTSTFCNIWVFISSSTFVIIYILMAWASIERHILVFHSNWFATASSRFFFHYLPLTICIVWPIIFYSLTLLILPYDYPFYYNKRQCGRYTCIYLVNWVGLWDSIVHYIIPALIVVTFSMALLARVIYHKYQIHQRVTWRNYKKLVAQLLPISTLYLCLLFPPMTLYSAYSTGLPRTVAPDYFSDGVFFWFWIILFTPFASVTSLPDLQTKCRRFFPFRRATRAIAPQTLTMNRLQT
ncbi:unnamed protein product [Adineta steineri]|uniref:G-protein coupled receptors family 1 profile domain-containing protein n=1 Tax=Adineta steineri TaxID=433720 RepID=A0A814VSX4_9BILA|nr:unnamed protein product [Adineta steineri]CAF1203812.1 unnamed protein product [Adineta steineri]CAF3773890.1 unnamed protein product [Adineta steineri]CAF4160697.1 unnamed protein product [Adineta steineri]